MKTLFFLPLISIFFLISCNGNEKDPTVKPIKKETVVTNPDQKKIEVLFEEATFQDKQSLPLLRELGEGICNPVEKDLENYIRPACDPKFFKFFPFKEQTEMKDAFVLLIKAKVHGFPIRRTFVYQREAGKLIKVNGFAANLIEMRKSKSKHDDLVLRFNDKYQNHFNCLFVWRNNHYEYEKVEQINDSDIKKELQDSMNIEIFKEIELEKMLQL